MPEFSATSAFDTFVTTTPRYILNVDDGKAVTLDKDADAAKLTLEDRLFAPDTGSINQSWTISGHSQTSLYELSLPTTTKTSDTWSVSSIGTRIYANTLPKGEERNALESSSYVLADSRFATLYEIVYVKDTTERYKIKAKGLELYWTKKIEGNYEYINLEKDSGEDTQIWEFPAVSN